MSPMRGSAPPKRAATYLQRFTLTVQTSGTRLQAPKQRSRVQRVVHPDVADSSLVLATTRPSMPGLQ